MRSSLLVGLGSGAATEMPDGSLVGDLPGKGQVSQGYWRQNKPKMAALPWETSGRQAQLGDFAVSAALGFPLAVCQLDEEQSCYWVSVRGSSQVEVSASI